MTSFQAYPAIADEIEIIFSFAAKSSFEGESTIYETDSLETFLQMNPLSWISTSTGRAAFTWEKHF